MSAHGTKRPFYGGRRMSVLGGKAVVQRTSLHRAKARTSDSGARCRGQSAEDRDCALPSPGCSIPTTKRCQRPAPSGRTIMLTRRKFIGTTLVAGPALTTSAQQARPQPASKRTIVDAQVHFWKASSPDWPWEPGVRPQLPEPFTIERALPMMDEAGVDRVIPTASESWAAFRCKTRNRRRCCRHGSSSRACSACA